MQAAYRRRRKSAHASRKSSNKTVLEQHLPPRFHHAPCAKSRLRELALVLGNQQAESLLVTRLHTFLDQYPVCFAITHGLAVNSPEPKDDDDPPPVPVAIAPAPSPPKQVVVREDDPPPPVPVAMVEPAPSLIRMGTPHPEHCDCDVCMLNRRSPWMRPMPRRLVCTKIYAHFVRA